MIKVNTFTQKVIDAIVKIGGHPYFVGGCVRDHIMGIEPKDIDIEVYGVSMNDLCFEMKKFGADLVGKSFGVIKVGLDIDVSLPRKDNYTGKKGHKAFRVETDPEMSFSEACSRRDFTINAIMMDALSGEIIDPFNGRNDIIEKTLRHVDAKHFVEDSLRVYRAAQFACRFGFYIHPSTLDLCNEIVIDDLPAERVKEELYKFFVKGQFFVIGLRAMSKLGILKKNEALHHPLFGEDIDRFGAFLESCSSALDGQDKFAGMISAYCYNSNEELFLNSFSNESALLRKVKNLHHVMRYFNWYKNLNDETLRQLSLKANLMQAAHIVDSWNQDCVWRNNVVDFIKHDSGFNYDPIVTGKLLTSMNVCPGPEMGRMIKEMYDRQLAGEFDDELGAKRILRRVFDLK